VRENLRYGRLEATDAEIEAAARRANAHEFIRHWPPILILDEPTSALDTISEMHFVDALAQLRGNRTTFVIAHRLSTVRSADRILVIDAGVLVDNGTHDDLVRRCPLYATLAGEFADAA
jgi:ABC-type multidrug transport system fused ATPase/permease subunit